MKIELDLPEWIKYQHIYIFAGVELLAKLECQVYREDGKLKKRYLPLKVKPADGRCTGCGSCCSSSAISKRLAKEMQEALNNYDYNSKACPFITPDGCLMKGWIPFSCAKSICTDYEGCTEYLVEVGD